MNMYRELIIGAGSRKTKDLRLPTAQEIRLIQSDTNQIGRVGVDFLDPTTLDNNENHKPDILCDLRNIMYIENEPLSEQLIISHRLTDEGYGLTDIVPDLNGNGEYDEIHAYEVLEHIGAQGDYKLFFRQFSAFFNLLKPNGLLFATCPSYKSMWAWGDPSHTRVLTPGTLAFLSQKEYKKQVGFTPMSDFRHIYKADFDVIFCAEDESTLGFVLRAIK